MKRSCAFLVVAGVMGACSSTPVVVPTKNLDRPVDIAFVCLGTAASGVEGQTELSGKAMEACHPRGAVDPITAADGLRRLGTFAFVANAGRGEMAVADMDRGRLLDLATQSPGYGMLPAGGSPECVAASPDGCWVVTANRTTCDFTLVDPSRLLTGTFTTKTSQAKPATGDGDAAHRLVVRTASGRTLHAATGEIALLPPAVPSETCNAEVQPRAVATFPGCDMVALLDLSFATSTARVVSAYYVRPDLPGGWQPAFAEPVCPVACSAGDDPQAGEIDGGAQSSVDGGSAAVGAGVDGGGEPTLEPASYLKALAVAPDGTKIYVAGILDTAVTSFDVGDAALGNPARILLAESPGGVSRLRLGVDPYATEDDVAGRKVVGKVLNARGSFLYAFANDDSIRVLDVSASPAVVECDVNILATPGSNCFPIGTPGRRPLARGPGIRIPVFTNPESPPPLPRDVAFVDIVPPATDTKYHALSGQFGFVLASNGQVYVLNLAPNGEDATATHSFREARDVGKAARTPISVTIAPQRTVLQSDQAFATTASFSVLEGPRIQPFSTDSGTTTRWLEFPDPDGVISRSWDVVWEGPLPRTTRVSGIVEGKGNGDVAGVLRDEGADFCSSGVQAGDVVMFSGCSQNSDCQPDDKFTCQVAVSGARGMCLPIQRSESAGIINRCLRFMGSRMRYEVAKATPTTLTLRLKLDEVPKTKLNPCQKSSDCRPDVDHGSLVGEEPPGTSVSRGFECVQSRCVKKCEADSDCRVGHMCDETQNLCVEALPVDASCFPQPMTTYSVRAGHSFVVTGSSLPTPHTGRVAADGTCQIDPNADVALINRIPLSAPECPEGFFNQTDPATGQAILANGFVQNLAAQAGANPCLYRGARRDGGDATTDGAQIRAFFQNPQIRFVLANLDDYAGDLLSIHFELRYGFAPLAVQIPSYEVLLTLGTRIVVGPTKTPESPIRRSPPTGDTSYPYLYVVDQGRTALTPGSRGQVLRINPRSGSNEIVTFDTTYSGSTPFQLQ